jgi:hypothetical protein
MQPQQNLAANQPITSIRRVMAAACLAALLASMLYGCGGGGDNGPAPEPPTAAISGWVGERSAWPQARVSLTCANGSTTQVIAGADGRYAATLPAAALPCLVQAHAADGGRLWSAAVAPGTANVTTLSSAVVARGLRVTPSLLFDSATFAARLTPAALAQAQADLDTTVAGLDLGQPGPAITTPVGASAGTDPLVRAHGRLIDQLAARDVTLATLTHALAHDGAPAALAQSLARADRGRLLALPAVGAESQMPQLVRGKVNSLVGSSTQALMLAYDLAFRSSDGGRSWQPLDLVLDTALAYKGALVGVGPNGAMRSTDGGLTWLDMQAPAAFDGGYLGVGPDLRLWWLRWEEDSTEALVSDDGIRWQAATSNPAIRNAVRFQLYRTPPLRSLVQEQGKPMRACLGTECTDVGEPGWDGVWRVHGSDEVLAWMPGGTPGISTDGLQWRAFGGADRWYTGGLLRTAPGRLLGLNGTLSASDDNGRTWQAVSTAPAEQWQATGTNLQRNIEGRVELSTDGGQQWHVVPGSTTAEPGAHAPDGSRLRIKGAVPSSPGPIEFSADGGKTWTTTVLANDVRAVAWLGDRWGAITTASQLHVSRDGRQWTLAGPVPSFSTESSFAGALGVWVVGWRRYPSLFPHALFESTDEGRTWTEIFPMAYPGEAATRHVFNCGGALFGTGHEFAVRKPEGWKTLPESRCMNDLLVTVDSTRASADHGDTWSPLPKPRTRTSTVFDGQDWWSFGWAGLTLWPRAQPR